MYLVRFFCAAFMSFIVISVSGQELWKRGEVILKDGTKLSGVISDREWIVNPTEIEFREDGKEAREFTVADLVEFSTERPVKFRAVAVSYDADGQAMDNLPPTKEPSKVNKEIVFLEVLVDAEYGLLYLHEKNGRKHFFIVEGGKVQELVDRWYGSDLNSQHFEYFKQQLALITNDCHQLQSQITRLRYNESDLTNFFRKLNQCKGTQVKSIWDGPKTEIRKRPVFGLSGQLFTSRVNFAYVESPMGSLNYGFGIFTELYDRKRPNRLSFFGEMNFQNVSQPELAYQSVGALLAVRVSTPEKSGERHYLMLGVNNTYRMNAEFDEDLQYYWTIPDNVDEYILGLALGFGKSFSIGGVVRFNTEIRYTYDRLHSAATGFNGAHNLGINLQLYPKR